MGIMKKSRRTGYGGLSKSQRRARRMQRNMERGVDPATDGNGSKSAAMNASGVFSTLAAVPDLAIISQNGELLANGGLASGSWHEGMSNSETATALIAYAKNFKSNDSHSKNKNNDGDDDGDSLPESSLIPGRSACNVCCQKLVSSRSVSCVVCKAVKYCGVKCLETDTERHTLSCALLRRAAEDLQGSKGTSVMSTIGKPLGCVSILRENASCAGSSWPHFLALPCFPKSASRDGCGPALRAASEFFSVPLTIANTLRQLFSDNLVLIAKNNNININNSNDSNNSSSSSSSSSSSGYKGDDNINSDDDDHDDHDDNTDIPTLTIRVTSVPKNIVKDERVWRMLSAIWVNPSHLRVIVTGNESVPSALDGKTIDLDDGRIEMRFSKDTTDSEFCGFASGNPAVFFDFGGIYDPRNGWKGVSETVIDTARDVDTIPDPFVVVNVGSTHAMCLHMSGAIMSALSAKSKAERFVSAKDLPRPVEEGGDLDAMRSRLSGNILWPPRINPMGSLRIRRGEGDDAMESANSVHRRYAFTSALLVKRTSRNNSQSKGKKNEKLKAGGDGKDGKGLTPVAKGKKIYFDD